MAAASGFSAFVAGVKKIESLNFKPCSHFQVCSAPIAVGRNNNNLRMARRGVSLNPRCCYDDARASSVSALEQLKNSDVDRYSKEKSSIVVVGLSFRTAPVEMREKLAIPEAEWPRAIEELCGLHHIDEAAVLSTCNRMEIYVVALSWHRGVREVTEWMAKKSGIPVSELRQHLVIFRDKDATQHLFEVSAGLDSLVLGEGQIQSQVKQVRKVSEDVPGFGRTMDLLFKCAVSVGARVRTDTSIATGAVSVGSAAVELALMKLPASSLPTTRVLVVGAGKMGKLVIRHLVSKGCTQMVVVNRSEERVALIRKELNNVDIIYKPLTEMFTCASEADVIFTSTASETPLFMKEHVEGLPPVGPNVGGIRLFVDISVPRNVGSCVSELDNAKVYNVDDLKEVVAANKEDRNKKAIEARVIISDGSKDFENDRCSLETTGATIKLLRAHVEGIRVPEYEKCLSEIEKCLAKMGHDVPEKIRKAVESLSRSMMNKILHPPMQHLRCDGSRSQGEVLENNTVFGRVYGLSTDKSISEQKIRAKKIKPQK